jgi:hypothetical protein
MRELTAVVVGLRPESIWLVIPARTVRIAADPH